MQKIKPCLWFDDRAEEAANFYTSIFRNSSIGKVSHYGETGPMPAGTVLTIEFTLDGEEFLALNGGPMFKFTEAVSLVVDCKTQAEIDEMWEKLAAGGGKTSQCGWLKDKFGLSWQVVPSDLTELMTDPDPEKRNRVMDAILKMTKLDIGELQRAYDNG